MEIQILAASNSADSRVWLELWQSLPVRRRDVYFLPGYVLANEADGRGEALCFTARRGAALLLHPFLQSPIPPAAEAGLESQAWDLQTPYGYGGPVVNEAGEESSFLKAAWEVFGEWCAQTGVVAEFCRFHPLLRNERWAGASTRIHFNRRTVYLDLETYPSGFQNGSFFSNHRQMVNHALRAGGTTESAPGEEAMGWFAPKYAATQETLGATAEARFGPAYFDSLARGLGTRASVRVIRRAGGVMARATLFLEGDSFSHAHLMAYGEDPKFSGATDLMLRDAAVEAAGRGLKAMHIGGGRTAAEDDPLLRFKAKLAPGRGEFQIGTRCHQPARYEALRRAWETRHGPAPKGFFLFYRAAAAAGAA